MSAADTLGPMDLVAWSRQILAGIKAPITSSNLTLMVAWARQEGGHNANSRRWNPLNTTQKMPGATYGGAQGNIASYASYADGVTATLRTITNGRYDPIVNALKAGNVDPAHIADLIGASPWGTGGPGIRANLRGAAAQVAAAGGGSSSPPPGNTTTDPTLYANPDGTPAVDPATGAVATVIPGVAQPYDLALYTPLTYGPGHDAMTIGYEPAPPETLAALVAAKLSLSTAEVTQLELTFEDPDLTGLANGALGELGTLITYGPLKLAIEAVEYGTGGAGTGGLTVTARPAGIAHLRNLKGPVTFRNVSPSDFAGFCALNADLHIVAQPSPSRPSIIVAAAPTTGGNPETYWSALGRLATELGYLVYEAAGTLFFGQPSWLIKTVPPLTLAWDPGDQRVDINEAGEVYYYRKPAPGGILTQPIVRRSVDPDTGKETKELTVTLAPEMLRSKWTTGSKVSVSGVAFRANGDYLITGIDVDLASPDSPATVTAAVTPDPAPQPPTDTTAAAGDASNDPSASSSAGKGPDAKPGKDGKVVMVGPHHQWAHPLNGHGTDAHNFGQHRSKPRPHIHAGTDISAPVGTPVLAGHAGTILSAGTHSGYGYAVYITHPGGLETRYGHLSRFAPGINSVVPSNGSPNDLPLYTYVRTGQVIGWSGGQPGTPGAGDATGPHLHYEIHKDGKPIDPEPYLKP